MMKGLLSITLTLLVFSSLTFSDSLEVKSDTAKEFDITYYLDRYKFMSEIGMVFTFESEFIQPEGYSRINDKKLSEFSRWISHFPIWHRDKRVTSPFKGTIYKKEEISRVVQFKWRATRLTDYGIPIQIIAEYYLAHDRLNDLSIMHQYGRSMSYREFLSGDLIAKPHIGIEIETGVEREHSELDFNKYVDLMIRESNYKSLTENGKEMNIDDLLPGDLLIGYDEKGYNGRTWIILNVLINKKGNKLFAVGTGCPEACAFHIPLFNNDRSNPWIDKDNLKELLKPFQFSGFYRLNIDN